MKKKNEILFDEKIGKNRIVISRDKYNWILYVGNKDWVDRTYFNKSEPWYFNDIYKLIDRLKILFFKNEIKYFEIKQIEKALRESEKRVIVVTKKIVLRGYDG